MNDRANIKWVGFILPEHANALRELYVEQQKEEEPELDEQTFEEFDWLIMRAIQEDKAVEMTYYFNGRKRVTRGHIVSLDRQQRTMKVCEDGGTFLTLRGCHIKTFKLIT
ncbi:YolD-like family protein [Aneurinibacillus tyrosinisolvens]|uniref:YolD-like family protein n=1 Tax=Aneurinibacillus tyrosinisolvens TaxID=1443435 RepID=UPI00069A1ADB|nr:YolD-like family protein [Aneurinibacillus tyrosinisolvens]